MASTMQDAPEAGGGPVTGFAHDSRMPTGNHTGPHHSPPIRTIGVDLGKNSFHLVGLDQRGAIVFALAYANVAFSGAVSICMLNLLCSAVRWTGNMALPAGVIVGSVIAHILISPLLIFGWGPMPALGPAGAEGSAP
ncbi:MAG TPA: hypothetical protein VM910_09595 [Bradyrhizobium sp.]|nr:hypothetical protein [Bradyrhizobium sp.]